MNADDILEKIDDCESIDEQIEVCEEYLPGTKSKVWKEVIKTVVKNMARDDDIDDMFIGVHLGTLADIKSVTFTKTMLTEDLYPRYVEEEVDSIGTEAKIPLDEWLVENIESVTKQVSTDSNVDVTYIFKFQGKDGHIATEEEHYSFPTFAKKIYKKYDVSTADPSETSNEGWSDWIESFIRERKTDDPFTGPRTQVIEELQSTIAGSDAYTDIEIAFNRQRIHYDEENNIYQIPSRIITSKCEDYGIQAKALQVELDEQGLIDGGCSTVEWINGSSERFWQIDADFADANIVRDEDDAPDNSRNFEGEKA